MFKKTKWRLTVLNSTIVALLFFVFSIALYQVVVKELNHRINGDIYKTINKLEIRDIQKFRPVDARIGVIFILKDGRAIATKNLEFMSDDLVAIKRKVNELYDVNTDDNFRFRVLVEKVEHPTIAYVQVVRNISSEHEQQEVLKTILIVGSIVCSLVSVVIGYVLAHFSLNPIQRSWMQQQRFTGDASHELRTPLAVIQGGVEQLLQEPDKVVLEHSETISRILKEIRRMNRLITDLLLLAKSDSNELLLKKERVNIVKVVEDVAEYFADVAISKEIKFEVTCEESIIVEVDSERIKQMLINLLDNSMKYTPNGGSVKLRLSTEQQKLIIVVEDTGIGIEKEHLTKVYERFYRVDKARTRDGASGSGLGLSIVKWIVDTHNGEVHINSEVGKGTKIIVQIPA